MRRLARLVAVLAAVGGGWLLLDARPREVDLVYDLATVPDAAGLRVEIRQGPDRVREAEFRRPGAEVRHRVRLRDGEYVLSWALEGPAGVLHGERALDIQHEQTIVMRLGP